jgi:hypothetical protein
MQPQRARRLRDRQALLSAVSHYRRNPAALNFAFGQQVQAGCDFGF